jgi:hypothetical protein
MRILPFFDISKALGLSERTIEPLKKRFAQEGLDSALGRKTIDIGSRSLYDCMSL